MDPLGIIVSALIVGAATAASATANQAIHDSYEALKVILRDRYRRVTFSLERLERQPDSAEESFMLRRAIKRSGAHQDERILELASTLWSASGRQSEPNRVIEYGRLMELSEHEAGQETIDEVLEDHLADILDIRKNHQVSNLELLSRNVVKNRDIPKSVKNEISNLSIRLRTVIQIVAQNIEVRKYELSEAAIAKIDSYTDREKAYRISSADKQVHISCQSMKVTIDYFSKCNETIIEKLEKAAREKDSTTETNLILGNALLIYELTDFVIDYIENFRLNGLPEIMDLHQATMLEIEQLRAQEESLRQQIDTLSAEDSAIKQQTLVSIAAREESLEVLEQEWNNYIDSVKELDRDTGSVQSKLPALRLIRENARNQINVLAAVAVLQILQNNLSELRAAIITLENIELAPLSADRVRRLLGV